MNPLDKKKKYPALVNFGMTILKGNGKKVPRVDWVPASQVEKLLSKSIPVFSQKDERGLMTVWERNPARPMDPSRDVMGFVVGPYAIPENIQGKTLAEHSVSFAASSNPETVAEPVSTPEQVIKSIVGLVPDDFESKQALTTAIQSLGRGEEFYMELGKILQEVLGSPDTAWKKTISTFLSTVRVALPKYVSIEGGEFDGLMMSLCPKREGEKQRRYEMPYRVDSGEAVSVFFTATASGLVAVAPRDEDTPEDAKKIHGCLLVPATEAVWEQFIAQKSEQ